MKPKHLIPPIAALAIAGLLLGGQRRSIANLKSGSAELRRHIAAAQEGTDPEHQSRPRTTKVSAADIPIDWEKLAGEIAAMKRQGGAGDMRKMMDLKKGLLAMESWELLAALDQIAALDLDGKTRLMLEAMILDPLAKKDPEAALNRFKDKLGEQGGGISWQLSAALASLAGRDMSAATAWYDKEISAGTFNSKSLDGKSPLRNLFESKLIAKMLESDLAGAKAWLSAKSPEGRKEILGGAGFQNLHEKDQAAHAELVRSQLDDDSRLDFIGKRVAELALGSGAADAEAYLDRIGARPDERQRSRQAILETVGKIKDPIKRRELIERFE